MKTYDLSEAIEQLESVLEYDFGERNLHIICTGRNPTTRDWTRCKCGKRFNAQYASSCQACRQRYEATPVPKRPKDDR